MNRMINVSTDVFAAIWASRQDGENSEDAIMRRLLGCDSVDTVTPSGSGIGFYDARNGVQFEEGFEVFRSYKGKQFNAIARNGEWVRSDTGGRFRSLSALNQSIVAGNENIWNGNWKYRGKDGKLHSINKLRRT